MPTESTPVAAELKTNSETSRVVNSEIATRRILRMALGTALSLCFSQVIAWPMSFMAPVFTMFLLALPVPVLSLQGGVKFLVALMLPLIAASLVLLPFLEYLRPVAVLLVALALYYSFYYTTRGGSPVLGAFITMGLTLVVTIGSICLACPWFITRHSHWGSCTQAAGATNT